MACAPRLNLRGSAKPGPARRDWRDHGCAWVVATAIETGRCPEGCSRCRSGPRSAVGHGAPHRSHTTRAHSPRLCRRCSTAARIPSASHAVQSSICGNPDMPALRPAATILTASRSEPYCWHKARNFVVKLTDGRSPVPEDRSRPMHAMVRAPYQPTLARPRTPLSVPPGSGLSRRCASTPSWNVSRSFPSTPRL